MYSGNLLLAALIDAEKPLQWAQAEWGLAIRQARAANLLATLASRVATFAQPEAIPEPARKHFQAAQNVIAQRNMAVAWECRQLCAALAPLGVEPVFLKGGAYVAAKLPLASHRLFSDIDLMVPRDRLAEAELQLLLAGWLSTNNDAYDQRYYRKWMHEIPPLQHLRRGTTLDLHHALSPLTAKYQARTEMIFSAAIGVPGIEGARVLGPPDMILHAATHLFAEGEADHALRNLFDISELLCHFQQQVDFHAALAERAFAVGLARPLFYAIHFVRKIFGQEALVDLEQALLPAAPGEMAVKFIESVYIPLFQGSHPSVWQRGTQYARGALYLRGHWLRMPGYLLVPHLIRKLIGKTGERERALA